MAENFVLREEFNNERDRINDKLSEHDKTISVLTSNIQSLVELPKSISDLDKTVALLGATVNDLKEEIKSFADDKEKQDGKISKIDSKSKIDFLTWIKNNWTSVLMFVIMLIMLVGQVTP